MQPAHPLTHAPEDAEPSRLARRGMVAWRATQREANSAAALANAEGDVCAAHAACAVRAVRATRAACRSFPCCACCCSVALLLPFRLLLGTLASRHNHIDQRQQCSG